jgi:hypothetical protein
MNTAGLCKSQGRITKTLLKEKILLFGKTIQREYIKGLFDIRSILKTIRKHPDNLERQTIAVYIEKVRGQLCIQLF